MLHSHLMFSYEKKLTHAHCKQDNKQFSLIDNNNILFFN